MMIGKELNNKIEWSEPQNIHKGDCLSVNAKEINLADEPLVCVVGSSISHITTDRTMTDGYEKEI